MLLNTEFRYHVLLPLATNYFIVPLLNSQPKIIAEF